ncbi:Small-conductance mechanosensitive channel [Pedobacter steynii]|uniref:Small-conductance mechanosensitive channel n=1 Tax=Pedobacter steynii TaxID=430522 RepID=A0A1G9QWH9_9SPHI|nr:mechanosensitive ion channel domain-containing protein [Pedobacter steynii]NQX37964.1 mechanosensitive ion channel [Pedobacter steynii]SDM15220.1 Small-conductance mechanosensitive channel [Pedobacter steynii]
MIEDKERQTGKELLMILGKALICLVLVYFYISNPEIYTEFPTLDKIADTAILFLGPSLIISILRLIVIYWYIKKHKLKKNIKDNFILGINRVVSILNTVVFAIAFTSFFDVDPKDLIFSVSIVAAALAVTFKDYIANMINGLIIMFSDRLSLGDHIRLGEHEGKILDITLINMILQNEDSDMVIIPNSVAFSSVIINQSKQNTKKLSIEFDMPLKNGYTPAFLEEYLNNAIANNTENVMEGGLSVKTIAINKDAAIFKVMVLLKHYDKVKERVVRRLLNTALLRLAAGQDELEVH